jgi:hypothetical protein
MQTKKTKPVVRQEYLTLKVEDFSVEVSTAVNPEARKPSQEDDSVDLYDYGSFIQITAICTSPEDHVNQRFGITVLRNRPHAVDFDATLRNVRLRDQDGTPTYRERRGRPLPLYDIPPGFTLLNRRRGTVDWEGAVWMPEQTITQLLMVLMPRKPLYLQIVVRTIDRERWLDSVTVQTSDPLGD